MRRLSGFISCGLLALATAAAQARETPPQGGEPKDFELPRKETLALDNGLAATFVPFGEVPKVTVSVVVRTGNLNEGDRTWLADLSGELMKEGTATRSAQEIATEAADMGGSVGVGVSGEQTSITADVLSEYGPQAVALVADVVRRPRFPESELQRIRGDLLRSLSVARSQPQSQASEAFHRMLYGAHAFGRVFPTEERLASYTIEDVRAYYSGNFGAQRTHVYVAGNFDADAMAAAVRDAFADWYTGPEPHIDVPGRHRGERTAFIDRDGAPQSTVFVGQRVVHPAEADYIPMVVMNTLLGGSFASRITRNLREDKGYTYSPSSGISAHYRDAYWLLTADVTTEVTGPALEEIFAEIRRLQSEPPSVQELDGIKAYRTGIFVLGNATRGSLIGQMAFLDLHGLDESFLTNYLSNVHAVTPAQVSDIARRRLPVDGMHVVIVGDLDRIEDQLAELPALTGTAPEVAE
ncbi:MAG TPA: pitrilysin family protein [Gammaproteobacteria bacterium]|nr:pitrilysin family protein [Gammaproteobacteria bacterium]